MTGLPVREVHRLSADRFVIGNHITPAQHLVIDRYLRQFADTFDDEGSVRCPGCSARIYGAYGAVGQGLGLYSFQWGIAHGEGYCKGPIPSYDDCGWPVVAYHRLGEVRFTIPLPVYPDELL